MKFKKDAIKPGMAIHCPKEGNVRVLLEHLTEMGYEVSDAIKTNAYRTYKEKICFYINPTENVSYGDIDFYAHDEDFRENEGNLIITEFSDLIEPDENLANKANDLTNQDNDLDNQRDNEMSAVEVLKWFRYTDDDTKTRLFEVTTVGGIFYLYTPKQIIDKIAAYEAAKKTPELKDVECGWRCEITYADDSADRYDLWGVSEEAARAYAKEKAKVYTAKMGRRAAADMWFICRVKEDE